MIVMNLRHLFVVVLFQLILFWYLKYSYESDAQVATQTAALTQRVESLQTQLGTVTQLLNDAAKERSDLPEQVYSFLSKAQLTTTATTPTPKPITETHPGIMQYRYTGADAKTNNGPVFNTTYTFDLALINDNGLKFWGWNFPIMLEYIFTDIGGEDLVRNTFRTVLGRREPKLVLDVGSNVGYFSLLAASYKTQRVYAFDPQRLCAERLALSAQVNNFQDRIVAINAFVAREEGIKGEFPVNTCAGTFSVNDKYVETDVKLAEVRSVNLATHFLNDPDLIDLIKVDVEGAELMVLEGSYELFVKHRVRNLVIELTPGWWHKFGIAYEDGAKIVKETLVDNGYKILLMPLHSWEGKMRQLSGWEELDQVLRPPPNFHNQQNFWFTLEDY